MPVMFEKRKQKRYVVDPINKYPYPAHIHDAVEIVVLRKGYMNITVNGQPYILESDNILAVFPRMVHSYEYTSEDADGVFIAFTPGVIDEFHTALTTLWPVAPITRIEEDDAELERAVQRLEVFSKAESGHPLLLAYLHLFMACLLMKLDLVPSSELHGNSLMYEVTDYIQEHSAENLSLESVAKAVGVGKSHLSHLFSQKLKINFRRYLNTIRVEKACILLQESENSIKQVCFECGFDSTRTFHRVFLEEQKMTPGEYRERMKKGIMALDEDQLKV